MDLTEFVRGYSNIVSDELVEEMLTWFKSGEYSRMENPNRATRKDIQKWVPINSDLYQKIGAVKKTMLTSYLDEFPYAYRGNLELESKETKIQRTDPKGGGFHNFHAEQSHYKKKDLRQEALRVFPKELKKTINYCSCYLFYL